jgi:hypothetical protein
MELDLPRTPIGREEIFVVVGVAPIRSVDEIAVGIELVLND